MTKRTGLLVFGLACLGHVCLAQPKVYEFPLDSIEVYVRSDPQYVRDIMKRCLTTDAPVSAEEYILLYYGSTFLEEYAPYGGSDHARRIDELIEEKRMDEAIAWCKEELAQNPGSVRGFSTLGSLYDMLGDTVLAKVYFGRYVELLSVPFFSGTGTSMDSAFVVRSVTDEYLILAELGLKRLEQRLVFDKDDMPYDVLVVKPADGPESEEMELYFNIYLPFHLGLKKSLGLEGVDQFGKKENKAVKKSKKKQKN